MRLDAKRPFLMDEYQKEVIEAPVGTYVVDAIAGSGKTACLTSRIVNLIDHGADPKSITMVTFTRKAAREMMERTSKLLEVKPDQLEVNNGTFHSLAFMMLRGYQDTLGLQLKVAGDEEDKELLEAELYAYIARLKEKNPAYWTKEAEKEWFAAYRVKLVLATIARAINTATHKNPAGVYPNQLQAKNTYFAIGGEENPLYLNFLDAAEVVVQINKDICKHTDYNVLAILANSFFQRKWRMELHNFDDLLARFYHLLTLNKDFQRYCHQFTTHLLVDEYQDVNVIQYEIVRALAQESLLCIGDKAQAIYGFRGSRSEYIEDFEDYFAHLKPVHLYLRKNYRSCSSILACAEKLINFTFPDIQLIPTREEGLVQWATFKSGRDEAAFITNHIKKKLENGVLPKDIAILVRGRRFIGNLEFALLQAKVPYKVVGDSSFFKSPYIEPAISFFKALLYKDNIFLKQCLKSFDGVGKKWSHEIYQALEAGMTLEEIAAKVNVKKVKAACLKLAELVKDASIYIGIDKMKYKSKHDLESSSSLKLLKEPSQEAPTKPEEPEEDLYDNIMGIYHVWDSFFYKRIVEMHTSKLGVIDNEAIEVIKRTQLALFQEMLSGANDIASFLSEIHLDDEVVKDEEEDESGRVEIMTMHKSKGLEWDHVYTLWPREGFPNLLRGDQPPEEADRHMKQERNLGYVALTRARKHLVVTGADNSYGGSNVDAIYLSRYAEDAGILEQEEITPKV